MSSLYQQGNVLGSQQQQQQQQDPVRNGLLKRRNELEKQIAQCNESISKLDAVLVMFPDYQNSQQGIQNYS